MSFYKLFVYVDWKGMCEFRVRTAQGLPTVNLNVILLAFILERNIKLIYTKFQR